MNTVHNKSQFFSGLALAIGATLFFLFTPLVTKAQQPGWDGEIEDVQVEIVSTREIDMPSANRHFEKIPPRPSEPIKPPIQYDFQSFSFLAPQINPQIKPLKLKAAEPSKIYGGFVRAGFGNYASPLLEGYINSRKNKDQLIGAHLYHSSSMKGPVDGRNSGSGTTTASVFARSFNENFAFSGSVDAENRSTHFYGYEKDADVDRSDIKQSYNTFKLAGAISNAKHTAFAYKLGAGFSYTADKFEARETEIDLDFNSSYDMDDDRKITIDANYVMLNRKDDGIDSKVRNLFSVTPSYRFEPIQDLKLSVGLILAYENETIDKKDLHVYPNASVSYPISPSVDLVASLTGGIEKVSLQTMSNKNIWIDKAIPLFHTNKIMEFNGGVQARLGNKVGVHSGLTVATIRNMHFFINSPVDQSRFLAIYEEKSFRRTNLFAALSYAQSEKARFMLRGDVFAYGTDDVKEAWHLPKYKLTANASLNIYDKVLLNFDVIGQGGAKALDPVTEKTVKLDGAFDLNAKAEYLFSPSFSFFLQFNNITSTNYPIYLYYPVRGFQVLGGITWSF
jgi:hypothetical protein